MNDPDADPLGIIIILILILVLTYVNAFFAAAEMAVVSVRKDKLKKLVESGNRKAKTLEKLTKQPTKFLSTIQVAITLAGFLSSAIAGSKLSVHMVSFFAWLGIAISETLAMVLVTFILSYFTLIFGELVPKRIALKNPEKVALRSARTISILMIITAPFVRLLSASTYLVLRLTKNHIQTEEEKVTEEEVRSMIITGHIEGVFNEEEKEMLEGVFRFNDLTAESIMTPRIDVFALNIDKPIQDYISEIIDEGFSRIPVYQRDIDNIVGILHIKDFLKEAHEKGFDNVKIDSIIREPYFVPEHIKIDVLFNEMKTTGNQIAILIDEYGGSVGIVTIEDLVEEIVGNIYDEYDEVDQSIQTIDENTYLVDGAIPIQDLNRQLKLNLEENNEDYDTLGGLIISILGYIPPKSFQEEIEYKNIKLKVHKIKANRIEQILLTILPVEEPQEEEHYEDY